MEKIKHFLSVNDHFARHAGIELMELSAGYAKAQMVITDCHLNGVKLVHGGAIFTLADFAFAAASNSHGKIAVGITSNITYMKPAISGILFAEAKELLLSNRLGNYVVNITNELNELVAVFQGMAYRKQSR